MRSRFSTIVTAVAACLLLLQGRHLSMTVFVSRFPPRARFILDRTADLIGAAFLITVIYAGLGAMDAMNGIAFTAMAGPVNLKFASVPVGAALMVYYLFRIMWAKRDGHGGR